MKLLARLLFSVVGLSAGVDPVSAQHSWGALYPSVLLTTDYRYNGASLTGHEPAVQGSLYWAGPDRFHAGVWVSTVDFSDLGDTTTSYEVDVYGGRTFDVGRAQLSLEAMYSFFPDNETPGPTYDFVTAKARISRTFEGLSVGGGLSYVPEAPYGSGPQWRVNAQTAYRWSDWLTTSASVGRRWSVTQLDRSFWDIGVTARWSNVSFDLRYSDTNHNFAECGLIDWCNSGLTLTLQMDLWR